MYNFELENRREGPVLPAKLLEVNKVLIEAPADYSTSVLGWQLNFKSERMEINSVYTVYAERIK